MNIKMIKASISNPPLLNIVHYHSIHQRLTLSRHWGREETGGNRKTKTRESWAADSKMGRHKEKEGAREITGKQFNHYEHKGADDC